MLNANFMALYITELKFAPIKVLQCGIGVFDLFCSCDLEIHQMCGNEPPTSRLLKVVV